MAQLGWEILVGVGICVLNLAGVALAALMLPGIWLMLLGAGLAQWWHMAWYGTEMFSWWTLGICAAIAVIAEVVELAASALGATKFGASRLGAAASIVGALLGAVVGSIVLPLVGTVVGGAVGAGLGALLAERHVKNRTWAEAGRSGAGAAIGRLAATLVKVGLAGLVGVVLAVAAFV